MTAGISKPIGADPTSYESQQWLSSVEAEYSSRTGVVTVLAAYSVTSRDFLVRVDATAGGVTVNLPPAAKFKGRQVYMKKIDASGNAATLDGNGSETIDGSATAATTTQYGVIGVISNGTNWDKIEG